MPIPYGKAGIERVLEGKADLTFAAEVPFSVAVIKGEALSLVATMLDISDSHGVIARRDRGISSVADLVGKKVGLKLGTSAEYFLWALLVRHRIAPDSVILVDLPPGQLAQALAEGSIDAVAVWQPYVLDTQNAVGENAVSFVDIDVYTQSSVLVARSDILKQRSVAIERLMRALLKAEQLSRSQPEESLKVVATWLKRDVEDLRPLWKALDFNISLQQSHLITLEDEARWAMNSGYVAKGPIHNFLPNLYLDALLAVKPERVTVVR